jgi:pSer/pThr/pTyr-binding forkhead associated (FHA) protein
MSWVIETLQRDGSTLARVRGASGPPGAAPAEASLTIGRALDNDLVLDDPHCAPHHARLAWRDGESAVLVDLGTVNGIERGRRERVTRAVLRAGEKFRVGQTQIRIRPLAETLAPEVPLTVRAMWPWALLALTFVIAHEAWELWVRHIGETTPSYLTDLSLKALAVGAWSGAYALLGRLISGAERFFTHLLIASCGYLAGTAVVEALELLAFTGDWLWPLRIKDTVIIIVVALTVRFHLRTADIRHWPTLRYAVALVAAMAIIVPVAQLWIKQGRLTNVDTAGTLYHPALRVARPKSMEAIVNANESLKSRVDELRKEKEGGMAYEVHLSDDD